MRPDPRRTAERLGLDQRTIRWRETHSHLQRLALTGPEIRARLYTPTSPTCARRSGRPSRAWIRDAEPSTGRGGTTMEKARTRIRGLLLLLACATAAGLLQDTDA